MSQKIPSSLLLAELLRIQRSLAGDPISAARIFGLMHGFQSVIEEETESFGISDETQEKAEDLLDEMDKAGAVWDGMTLKHRIREVGISEEAFSKVCELCLLQSRFVNVIQALADRGDCRMVTDREAKSPIEGWFGPTIYMEIVDTSADAGKRSHAVFSSVVPRVGDTIEPRAGELMTVVEVRHIAIPMGEHESGQTSHLTPTVFVEPTGDEEDPDGPVQ